MKEEKYSKEDIISLLGEGFHTAFRKISQSKEGRQIHSLINKLDNEEWEAILEFVWYGMKNCFK